VLGSDGDLSEIRELLDDAGGPCEGFAFVLDDTILSDGGLYVHVVEAIAGAHEADWAGYNKHPFPIGFEELSGIRSEVT
jgi:hypothetical protein